MEAASEPKGPIQNPHPQVLCSTPLCRRSFRSEALRTTHPGEKYKQTDMRIQRRERWSLAEGQNQGVLHGGSNMCCLWKNSGHFEPMFSERVRRHIIAEKAEAGAEAETRSKRPTSQCTAPHHSRGCAPVEYYTAVKRRNSYLWQQHGWTWRTLC